MDTSEVAFEANVELDAAALRAQEEQNARRHAQQSPKAARRRVHHGDEDNEPVHETSPLLQRSSTREGDRGEDGDEVDLSNTDIYDFRHLPWYRRPSIFWVLAPFFLMACAFGGILAPKMNLITELICRQYISEQIQKHPTFSFIPIDFNDGDNAQCRIPEVSSRVALFTLWGNLIAGTLSALMSPYLGALSDRYGRKRILVITSVGTICGELITIGAAAYPEKFPVDWLLLSYALDGLTGSFIVAMAIANSYASDCTAPERRNVAFGYFHSCLFSGIAIGPIVAGYIVKQTGRIVVIFYILTAVHLWFVLFISIFVPESLSKARQHIAREKYRKLRQEHGSAYEWKMALEPFNVPRALKVLRPTGPGTSTALRRNLALLAAVDTMSFGVGMGSISVVIIYMRSQFGWGTFESGRFLTIVNTFRVLCLMGILPLLTRLVRGKATATAKQQHRGADVFDLTMIRIAIFFDMLGYLGYTLARSGPVFVLSGVVAAVGGIGSPTMQSALTKHVPPEYTGQLLGASAMLHGLARVVAPTVFNAIFSMTVGKFTQTVFVCLSASFGLALFASFFLRPHLYVDESLKEADDTASSAPAPESAARVPIADAVADAAEHLSERVSNRQTASSSSARE